MFCGSGSRPGYGGMAAGAGGCRVGLFIAGPWLTMAAARAMARWTSRPATLIAAGRLADDPRAAFHAVSGLVLALFITTVAVVAISTQNAKNLTRWSSAAEANVLTNQVSASNQVAGSNGPGASQSPAAPGAAAPAAPLVAPSARTCSRYFRLDVPRRSAGHKRTQHRSAGARWQM